MSAVVVLTPEQLRELVADALANTLADFESAGQSLLTQTELAERLKVSLPTLRQLREGGLPTVWILESPRFDWETCVAWLSDPSKSGHLRATSKVTRLNSSLVSPKAAGRTPKGTGKRKLVEQDATEPKGAA